MTSSWWNNLADRISLALPDAESFPTIPVTHHALVDALTFQTPELAAERRRIDEEERRKESVKEALARLLPWETANEEQEILVEECREAVLRLSDNGDNGDATFRRPFGCGDLEGELQAMEALEDYPRLLRVFDLDAHVGLIRRLFEVDRNLVEMHAQLSGSGDVEYNFWKNYFYHCGLVRQKIGLSNEEIWDQAVTPKVPPPPPKVRTKADDTDNNNTTMDDDDVAEVDDGDEGSITFEAAVSVDSNSVSEHDTTDTVAVPATVESAPVVPPTMVVPTATVPSRERSPEQDYEIEAPVVADGAGEDDLDDLEAEIARELAL